MPLVDGLVVLRRIMTFPKAACAGGRRTEPCLRKGLDSGAVVPDECVNDEEKLDPLAYNTCVEDSDSDTEEENENEFAVR